MIFSNINIKEDAKDNLMKELFVSLKVYLNRNQLFLSTGALVYQKHNFLIRVVLLDVAEK